MFGRETLRALWKSERRTGAATCVARRSRLMVEELEDRRMLSNPSVGFALSGSTASESAGQASLVVALSTVSNQPVTVDYNVTGGTAAGGGVDFLLTGGKLTFNPGQTRLSIPIALANDALDENHETIQVTLSNAGNATLGTLTSHTLSIVDNDTPPIVGFDLDESSGGEGASPANLTVSLSAASGRDVTVKFYTSGLTAKANVDYQAAAAQLTFAPGQTVKTIALNIVDDALDENDERFAIVLYGATRATLGQATHFRTIVDNDSAPTVAFQFASLSGGESTAFPSVNVALSAPSGKPITVAFATTGGTATRGIDYGLPTGKLVFRPGQTIKKLPLFIGNDRMDEPDENILVTLSAPTNATLGSITDHDFTIMDDDGLPSVSFRRPTSSASESLPAATILVSLSRTSGKVVTVDYAPTGGTATNGVDYNLTPGTLTFNPGQLTRPITIQLIDDALDEVNETVLITLTNPIHANLGITPTHTFVIIDNDRPPSISFVNNHSSGGEVGLILDFVVSLSAVSTKTITVNFGVTGGTAKQGIDYLFSSGTLTFLPGETSKTISLTLIDDAEMERAETVRLALSGFANALVGLNPVHVFTIQDDEPIPSP